MKPLVAIVLALSLASCELFTRPGEIQFVSDGAAADASVDASSGMDAIGDSVAADAHPDIQATDAAMTDTPPTDVPSDNATGADGGDTVDVATDSTADVGIDVGVDIAADHGVDVVGETAIDAPTDHPDGPCTGMICGGSCVNTASDPNNCASCGYSCNTRPRTMAAQCIAGTCSLTCQTGYGDCDASRDNGCETDLNTTVAHCSSCSNACPTPPHTSPTCVGAACGFSCVTGYSNCDNIASNGCEVPLGTNSNCGGCGASCPAGDSCTSLGTGASACCRSAGVSVACAVAFCGASTCRVVGNTTFCCD